MTGDRLKAVRIFGSVVRQDNDAHSDLDVLAVLDCPLNDFYQKRVENISSKAYERAPSISWYGPAKIASMFADGHLFAWHLYQESERLLGEIDALDELGSPNAYKTALGDIRSFVDIIESVEAGISRCDRNASFEAGLLYVALRNIAMSASWYTKPLDFSRYAPFGVSAKLGTSFPLSRDEFQVLIDCRMAAQRGISTPHPNARFVKDVQVRSLAWAQNVIPLIERMELVHDR